MPPLQGILETALYVSDLEKSENWYREVLGGERLLRDERMCALKISPAQILLLFKIGGSTEGEETPGGFIPPHDGNGNLHLAFHIEARDVDAWRKYLQQRGVNIESEVDANDGHSIYFRDPDGHAVELGTSGLWNVGKK